MSLAHLALAAALAASPAKHTPNTKITWYEQAGFKIETPKGKVLMIDPWLTNPKSPLKDEADPVAKLGKVDYVLVTHGHFDHVGQAVAIGKATGAKLVTVMELGNLLKAAGYPEKQAGFDTLGEPGSPVQLDDEVTVTMIAEQHSSGFDPVAASGAKPADGTPPPPLEYGGVPVGFVIQIANGPTIYHTGDTDVFYDMKDRIGDRFKVDVMLACIGGHFTMDPDGAALAANYVHPKVIVPMHFDLFPVFTGTPDKLRAALKAGKNKAQVVELKPGVEQLF